jgi:hypothetical protein
MPPLRPLTWYGLLGLDPLLGGALHDLEGMRLEISPAGSVDLLDQGLSKLRLWAWPSLPVSA